jgi:hypothetical protein
VNVDDILEMFERNTNKYGVLDWVLVADEILALDSENKCYNDGKEVETDCVHDWMCSKCANWMYKEPPETHESNS